MERAVQVRRWTILATDLADETSKLKASLSPHKRLCLLSLLVREAGHEDLNFVDDLKRGSTLTKRFPVRQKNKVGPIDDYTASLVNFAVTQNEGATLHTIDHIAAMMACLMRKGSIKPEDGLVAKCWDLSDAYKQVPLSDEAFDLDSYLAMHDPNSKSAKIFKQSVLPFGSIASVTAFLRGALAIWKVGTSLIRFLWSAYFDDFL